METSLLQEKLDGKADRKLDEAIDKLFNISYRDNGNFDFCNTHINKEEAIEAINTSSRIENIIPIIKKAFFEAYQNKYRQEETNNFLNKIESIDSDISQLRNELNL
jgi:hypothetical protein